MWHELGYYSVKTKNQAEMKTRNALFIGLFFSLGCYFAEAAIPSSVIVEDIIESHETNTSIEPVFKTDTLDLFEFSELEEEDVVEDLPFDTRSIYLDHVLFNDVVIEEESEFKDIPFDTFELYCAYLSLDTGLRFRNIDKYILGCLCEKRTGIARKLCEELEKQLLLNDQIAMR